MKTELKLAAEELYEITNKSCKKNCPLNAKWGCCDDVFCSMVAQYLKKLGKEYPQPNYKGIRFMGLAGCTVPPGDRPLCSGFACKDCLNDKDLCMGKLMKLDKKMKTLLQQFMESKQ